MKRNIRQIKPDSWKIKPDIWLMNPDIRQMNRISGKLNRISCWWIQISGKWAGYPANGTWYFPNGTGCPPNGTGYPANKKSSLALLFTFYITCSPRLTIAITLKCWIIWNLCLLAALGKILPNTVTLSSISATPEHKERYIERNTCGTKRDFLEKYREI